MPLSEDEQRILREIERTFYENDPEFAGKVRNETLYRHAGRNCKWAALGIIGGLLLMLFTFATNPFLGFAGFIVMLVCAIVFWTNLRKMGKAGWQQLTQSVRARGISDAIGDTGKKLRQRFKREE